MTGPEATVVTYSPEGRAPRRLVFEPLSDGSHLKREQVRNQHGEWHEVGSERVSDIAIEGPDDE